MERKGTLSWEADTRPGDMLWGFLLVWSRVWHRLLSPPPPGSFANARAAGYDDGQEQEKKIPVGVSTISYGYHSKPEFRGLPLETVTATVSPTFH